MTNFKFPQIETLVFFSIVISAPGPFPMNFSFWNKCLCVYLEVAALLDRHFNGTFLARFSSFVVIIDLVSLLERTFITIEPPFENLGFIKLDNDRPKFSLVSVFDFFP